MKPQISAEICRKAIRLYKNPNLTVSEIANLLNVSNSKLIEIYHQEFLKGSLTPRRKDRALQPANNKRKFTAEQEQEIAKDYYINKLSAVEIYKKWDAHPMQLQRIRNELGEQFGKKRLGRKRKPRTKVQK